MNLIRRTLKRCERSLCHHLFCCYIFSTISHRVCRVCLFLFVASRIFRSILLSSHLASPHLSLRSFHAFSNETRSNDLLMILFIIITGTETLHFTILGYGQGSVTLSLVIKKNTHLFIPLLFTTAQSCSGTVIK